MVAMTEPGTEKRLDDLREETHRGREETHRGFERSDVQLGRVMGRLEADTRELRSEIRELRSDMKVGFESMHKLMIRFFAGTIGTVIAGVVVTLLSHS